MRQVYAQYRWVMGSPARRQANCRLGLGLRWNPSDRRDPPKNPVVAHYNANILTRNTTQPRVRPMAITAARFRAVGTIVATQTGQT